jgi:hypothetical protein
MPLEVLRGRQWFTWNPYRSSVTQFAGVGQPRISKSLPRNAQRAAQVNFLFEYVWRITSDLG